MSAGTLIDALIQLPPFFANQTPDQVNTFDSLHDRDFFKQWGESRTRRSAASRPTGAGSSTPPASDASALGASRNRLASRTSIALPCRMD